MGEKDIKVGNGDSNGTPRTVKAKYLRVVLTTILLLGVVMYTCCTILHPTSMTIRHSHTQTQQINQVGSIIEEGKDNSVVPNFQATKHHEKDQEVKKTDEDEKNHHHKLESPTTTIEVNKRADSSSSSDSDSDSSESSDSKSTPIYDRAWMRFIFALGGIIVLNMIAICIHHLYMIVTRSQNRYREFEDEKSPF
ncbi:hypothetical protein CANMA_002501 [Candida margitis]|uniref:uncharacterized protein n=1 Tax=Candida margitis TaxID=1775924 RepID=UPI002227938D|nr:uncharacterized protein CANMA_002501 [Candida margitis]KAI5968285.1 hypothetical protein CANMA_002501 [Candida margitis]